MNSYFAYIRVSTVRQGEKGSSLHEQRDAILAYAQRHSLSISSWFEEMETAAKTGRRQFARMLALLQKQKARGVILHKIDRGARNLRDWADLRSLTEKGVEVHFAHDSLDITTRGGALSADIQAVIAADYIRNLREEVRKGFYGRLKQGFYPLPAPIGYLDRGGGVAKEIDPMRGPLIQEAFRLYATGNWGLKQLAELLYERGLRTRGGGMLDFKRLAETIANPFYVGVIRLASTGETFSGVHKPLIAPELFMKVQAVRQGKLARRVIVHDFLFRRLVHCRECGYALIGETKKGYVYYRCHTEKCPVTSLREEVIDQEVRRTLRLLQFTPSELLEIQEAVSELKRNWAQTRDEQIRSAKAHIGQLNDRIRRITDAYVDGLLDRGAYTERHGALLLERRSAEDQLANLEQNGSKIADTVAEYLGLAQRALLSYETANFDEKRETLKSVTSDLYASPKNVVVELRSPFSALKNRGVTEHCGPSSTIPRTGGAQAQMKTLLDIIVEHCRKVTGQRKE